MLIWNRTTSVSIRDDVIAIKGLKVGVFTEVLSAEIDGKKIVDLSTFKNVAGDEFANKVSKKFKALSKVHPSFSRVLGLDELVALTEAISEMTEIPDLNWWLKDYRLKKVVTHKKLKVLKRSEKYQVPVSGGYYEGYREISGGVQLMAIALRLNNGDVTALKEAVLISRPNPMALSWGFVVGEWIIPMAPSLLEMEDIVFLYNQAMFLQHGKHYDDAITLHTKIIEFKPDDMAQAYFNRATAYSGKEDFKNAIADLNKAININPNYFAAYSLRSCMYGLLFEPDSVIADASKALEIEPTSAGAYDSRGLAYKLKGDIDAALADFNRAIDLGYDRAYIGRSAVFMMKGDYDAGSKDNQVVINLYPEIPTGWAFRAFFRATQGKYKQALQDVDRALKIDFKDTDVWFVKAAVHDMSGNPTESIAALEKFLEFAPTAMHNTAQVKFAKRKIRQWNNGRGSWRDILRNVWDKGVSYFEELVAK